MAVMKTKTIRKILNRKFDSFLKTIEDERVRELVKENTIITGGCIASMLMQEEPNDFDMYFRNAETVKAVAEYYVDQFCKLYPDRAFKYVPGGPGHDGKKIALYVHDSHEYISGQNAIGGVDTNKERRIKIVARSAGAVASEGGDGEKNYAYFEGRPPEEGADYVDAITEVRGGEKYMEDFTTIVAASAAPPVDDDDEEALNGSEQGTDDKKPTGKYRPLFLSSNAITLSHSVQLIIRFYGEPGEIHENYDFVHCTNFWDSKTKEVVLNKDALEAILTRELKYVGSRYPLASLVRTRKFIKRGFTIHAGQILKMAMQVQELDLKDPVVLEEQLTGVDVAYFHELIYRLRAEGKEITSSYIAELVDRIID